MCKKSLLLSFFLSGIFLSSSVHSQELDVQNYRTIDGSENNLNVPSWGAAHTNLLQVTTLGFADGFSSVGGVDRPNPREISNNIFAQDGLINDPEILSDYIWVWGQFLDHDIGFTVDGDEPLMIEIPAGDPNFDPFGAGNAIIPMRRNNFDPSTGTGIDNPRLYINEVTAYIDGSAVYGSDEECAAWLRSFSGGQLKVSAGNLLPYNTSSGEFDDEIDPAAPHMENATSISDVFFVAGDPRANENPLLVAMHTLFVREHNRECEVLARLHPDWDDEQIYQHARKMVGGKIQSIVFDEWLPAMGIILPAYEGYDPTVNAQLMNVFTAAAFRLGHTLLSSNIVRLDDNGDVIPQGNMTLREAFFNPFAIQQTGGIDPFLRGIGVQVQQAFDSKVIDDIRNFLFGQPGAGGLDLASININRGRERGLPDFNTVRADMGLEPYDFWQQINPSAAVFTRLLSTYVDINNVDPWVGMLAERKVIGSIFGETLYEIMRRQFTALRDGDRFYYWNDPVLSQEEKETIHRTSFRDIVMYNTGISRLQDDVFSAIPPNGICVNMSFDLNGQIQTVEGEPLTDVSLELSMLNGNQEQLTGPDGAYSFSDLPFCDLNVLSPYRNDDPLNGVSTFDIILISKHILGIDIITDPYDLIAGDINGNGSITTLDLVRLRKVILGIDSDFGENTSWRFVLGAYEFPDNEDPLTSDFPVSLNFQAENLADYNSGFIAIKVGDVNRSADPENFTGEEVTFRSQPLGLEIQFTDRLLRAGEEYWVDLDLIMAGELLGWQFELASDQLDLLQVDSDWPAEYYNYWDDKLRMSYSENSPFYEEGKLSLRVKAREDIQLSDALFLGDELAASAYLGNEEVASVLLKSDFAENDFELGQNTPNPFSRETLIPFYLPQSGQVLLEISDVNGRIIYTREKYFTAGNQQWKINKQEIGESGAYYYKIQTSNTQSSRLLIVN